MKVFIKKNEAATQPIPEVQLKKVFFYAYGRLHHEWIHPDFEDKQIEELIQKQICTTAYVVRVELWQGNQKISETVYYEYDGYSYVRTNACAGSAGTERGAAGNLYGMPDVCSREEGIPATAD